MARILVIDDDPDILLITEHTLADAGHYVVTSTDPAQVATLALEHKVDAVVLDVMMPDVSGFDALHALRPADVKVEARPTVDGARRLYSVDWSPGADT